MTLTSSSPPAGFSVRRMVVVGVGLLGGSVAKAIRRHDPEVHIVGVSRTESTRRTALELGVIDEAHDSIVKGCAGCDVVVICTPVDRIAAQVVQAAAITPNGCLITDVGSTKARIVDAVSRDAVAVSKFVAAHPIAGSEKTGVEHSTAELFDDKVVIVSPSEQTTSDRQRQAESFWMMTGGRVLTMTPQQHDEQLAAVSHLPHLMAALVAKRTPGSALPLAGGGWKDITRVAAGDPEMWAAICAQNTPAILAQLQLYSTELQSLTQLIEHGDLDALQTWLRQAQSVRQQADS